MLADKEGEAGVECDEVEVAVGGGAGGGKDDLREIWFLGRIMGYEMGSGRVEHSL
jgi:hypothetical protein